MAHVLSDIIEEDEEEEEEGPMPFTVAHHQRGIKIILAEFTVQSAVRTHYFTMQWRYLSTIDALLVYIWDMNTALRCSTARKIRAYFLLAKVEKFEVMYLCTVSNFSAWKHQNDAALTCSAASLR